MESKDVLKIEEQFDEISSLSWKKLMHTFASFDLCKLELQDADEFMEMLVDLCLNQLLDLENIKRILQLTH